MSDEHPGHLPERLTSIVDTADALGIPVWKLRRAIKAGLIPSYRFYDSKVLLRLSEVVAFIESTRQGGAR